MNTKINEFISKRRPFYSGVNIKLFRRKYNLTQIQLANVLNVSLDTLRNWEQGKNGLSGPAQRILDLFDKHPECFIS